MLPGCLTCKQPDPALLQLQQDSQVTMRMRTRGVAAQAG